MFKRSYSIFAAVLSSAMLATSAVNADTLMQIFDLASRNDPEIRAAEASLRANTLNRSIARSALLPQINATATYSEAVNTTDDLPEDLLAGLPDELPDGIPGEIPDTETEQIETTLAVSLDQLIFDLPSWYSYRQGDAVAEQAEQDYLLAKQDLMLRTMTAYLDVLRSVDTLETSRAEEKAVASQLDQATQRYEAGLAAITDVLEAQAAYDDVIADMVLAQGMVGISFEGLTVLTGQNHLSIAPMLESLPIINPIPTNSEDWVNLALEQSHSLASARLNRDAARFNAQSSRMEHLPSLSLSLAVQESRPETPVFVPEAGASLVANSQTTFVAVTLNVPIYNGGNITAQRKQANFQYIEAEENLSNIERTLIQNTRSFYLSALTGVSTVKARKQAVKSSESALEATQAGYDVGTRNLVELLQAERALFAAQLAYSNSLYDYILDSMNLRLTAGVLNTEDIDYYNRYLDNGNQLIKSSLMQSTTSIQK